MEYIIAAVILAAAVGGFFYMKKKKEQEKEPKIELPPWEQPKPKRPAAPPPQAGPVLVDNGEEPVFAPKYTDAGWGVELEDFGAPLNERPAEGIEGWETVKTIVALLPYYIYRWRNPETGKVQWVDYNPGKPDSMDWYYIAAGCVDVTMTNWNALWMTADKIDSRLQEEGLQRVRDYKGGLRSNPNHWPEPYKSVYLESHPEA